MFHIQGVQKGSERIYTACDIKSIELYLYLDYLIKMDYDFFILQGEYKIDDGKLVLVEEFKSVATFINGYYAFDSGSKLPEDVIKLLKDGHKMGAPLR